MNSELKDELSSIFAPLPYPIELEAKVHANHPQREGFLELLQEVASCSEKIDLKVVEGPALELSLHRDGRPLGVCFKAIPTAKEFSSLVLALLNAEGLGENLPSPDLLEDIKALPGPIHLQTFILLTCPNCPDVVQALNVLALLREDVTHCAIDCEMYQAEADALGVEAVPAVFLEGELIHVGRCQLPTLVAELQARAANESAS